MKLRSSSFADHDMIPTRFAFAKPDPENHISFADNISPQLSWSDVPQGTKSFALLCIDSDVPSVGDDVNQEGKIVAADLPRVDFVHWCMADIPGDCRELAEAACGEGVIAGGKSEPSGPTESRQGLNDFTAWFATTDGMKGDYLGYDGPAPPWNDELMHHYVFSLYALDLSKLALKDKFSATDVKEAMSGHILAEARITGRYSQNPKLL